MNFHLFSIGIKHRHTRDHLHEPHPTTYAPFQICKSRKIHILRSENVIDPSWHYQTYRLSPQASLSAHSRWSFPTGNFDFHTRIHTTAQIQSTLDFCKKFLRLQFKCECKPIYELHDTINTTLCTLFPLR